jgi:hypothetical protein
MNRRSFLSLSGATLAAAAMPRGGECLFAQAQSAARRVFSVGTEGSAACQLGLRVYIKRF